MATANPDDLIKPIQDRFAQNMPRHIGIDWRTVDKKLQASPQKLKALLEMDRTGGEPDVIGCDPHTGDFIFCDCSPESLSGRRSLCYDRKALDSRKEKILETRGLRAPFNPPWVELRF